VAARGLDIPDVELIIQLSPPEHIEPFIHRSGRTGRAGRKGTNIVFFDRNSLEELIELEDKANISIKVITGQDELSIWRRKADNLID
jgi:superfamily II DNA/RNA helicase